MRFHATVPTDDKFHSSDSRTNFIYGAGEPRQSLPIDASLKEIPQELDLKNQRIPSEARLSRKA